MRRRSRGDSRMKITLEKHPALNIEITDKAITTNLRELIGIPEEIKDIEDLKDEQYIQGSPILSNPCSWPCSRKVWNSNATRPTPMPSRPCSTPWATVWTDGRPRTS